jgi:hypothetical protein
VSGHPSIFELSRFIEAGAETDAFEAHVSGCVVCSSQLSRLAHRSMVSRGLSAEVALPSMRMVSPAIAGFVALMACIVASIAQPARASMAPTPAFTMLAPEGVHGTPSFGEPGFTRLESPGFNDAGLSSPPY